jgi:membrane protein implicated in regulation of membrane protease activity
MTFEWFTEMPGDEKMFTFCAAVGGVLFILRLVLMFLGAGDQDADMDLDADVDAHIDAAGDVGSADFSFKILSLQGLTAFFTMFGLVGLAMKRDSGMSTSWALLGGFLAGLAGVWLVSWVFCLFKKLQDNGTLNYKNALGQEGRIYLKIPANGTGKIEVAVQGRLLVLNARARDQEEIPTDARVKVVEVARGNIMIVEKL